MKRRNFIAALAAFFTVGKSGSTEPRTTAFRGELEALDAQMRERMKNIIRFGSEKSLLPPLSASEIDEISWLLCPYSSSEEAKTILNTPEFKAKYNIDARQVAKRLQQRRQAWKDRIASIPGITPEMARIYFQ